MEKGIGSCALTVELFYEKEDLSDLDNHYLGKHGPKQRRTEQNKRSLQ